MTPLPWQPTQLLCPLLVVDTIINYESFGCRHAHCPQKNQPPSLPISEPVIESVVVLELVCHVNAVHVKVVNINKVEAEILHLHVR